VTGSVASLRAVQKKVTMLPAATLLFLGLLMIFVCSATKKKYCYIKIIYIQYCNDFIQWFPNISDLQTGKTPVGFPRSSILSYILQYELV
jgi:hypothetical protein